jgi:hypothetical protein
VATLAIVYRFTGPSFVAAKLFLFAALVAATVLSALVARVVWPRCRLAGPVAAVLTATSPALRHYAGTVQYEVLVAAGAVGVLWLAVRAVHAHTFLQRLQWVGLLGGLGGWLIITRETFVAVVPLVVLWAGMRMAVQGPRRTAAALALTSAILAMFPAAAWSLRQSREYGHPIVITDKGPVTFMLGNNASTSGTYDIDVVTEPSGWAFVREHPGQAAALAWRKAMYFWGVRRDVWNVPRATTVWLARATGGWLPPSVTLPLARGGWLLAAALLGTLVLWRRGLLRAWWVLPAAVSVVWLGHIATLSSHRFAIPMLPIVFVLASGPVTEAVEWLAAWLASVPWRLAGGLSVLAFAIAAQWLVPGPDFTIRAVETDGMNARSAFDDGMRANVRVVDAGRARPALVLADTYFGAGAYQLVLSVRRGLEPAALDADVAQVSVFELSGRTACAENVPAGLLEPARFTSVFIPCRVSEDGPVTLTVHTTGRVGLAFHDVAFYATGR